MDQVPGSSDLVELAAAFFGATSTEALAVWRGAVVWILADWYLTLGRRVLRQLLGLLVHHLKLGRMKARPGHRMRKLRRITSDTR